MSNPPTVGEGPEALGSSSLCEDTHRAADGAVLARATGVRLEGRMDGPNPMMRVTIEREDGTECEIIQDNGTIISHWARIP